jgi:peptidoglycan/LPS O-acetylase OafA/YrhL
MPPAATPSPSSAAEAVGRGHLNRFHSLDALRAGLFLMILYSHTVIEPALVTENGIEMFLSQIMWSGVQGFFVLSGFIITTLLLREHQRSGTVDVLAFYRRRALKILPPLVVMVAAVTVLIWHGALSDQSAWNALPSPGTAAAAATWQALPWMLGLVGNIPYALGLISITPALLIIWTAVRGGAVLPRASLDYASDRRLPCVAAGPSGDCAANHCHPGRPPARLPRTLMGGDWARRDLARDLRADAVSAR